MERFFEAWLLQRWFVAAVVEHGLTTRHQSDQGTACQEWKDARLTLRTMDWMLTCRPAEYRCPECLVRRSSSSALAALECWRYLRWLPVSRRLQRKDAERGHSKEHKSEFRKILRKALVPKTVPAHYFPTVEGNCSLQCYYLFTPTGFLSWPCDIGIFFSNLLNDWRVNDKRGVVL